MSPDAVDNSPDIVLRAGDVVACFGTSAAARVISWGTASAIAPRGLRVGPSHVAIICEHRGRSLWVESTTLCEHRCEVRGRPAAGVQAHPPGRRINDYVAAGGRVDVYRFTGLAALSVEERTLLHRLLVGHLLGSLPGSGGGHYDLGGAVVSGTRLLRLLKGAELNALFCSELVAAVLMRLGRMNHANPARFHPARLLRELVRTGKVVRVASLRQAG